MTKFLKNQSSIWLIGFAFWLPLGVLIFVIVLLLTNAEDFGRSFLSLFVPQYYIHPGYGIALGIVVIYISGFILNLTRIRKIFSKIPILGPFFGSGQTITVDRLFHLQPCLFLMSPTCLSYGWVLSEEKVRLSEEEARFDLMNVYYPNVPTLVTGQVFPVRKETVIRLGNSSKEVIDLLLYAFRRPEEIKYLPWEGESQEEFVKRAKNFGIITNDEQSLEYGTE